MRFNDVRKCCFFWWEFFYKVICPGLPGSVQGKIKRVAVMQISDKQVPVDGSDLFD